MPLGLRLSDLLGGCRPEREGLNMKASIDERGCLSVAAETALESYALNAWWDGYDRSTGTQTSTLMIVRVLPAAEPAPEQGPHLANCTKKLQAAGKAYPRTCAECGLGPCRA